MATQFKDVDQKELNPIDPVFPPEDDETFKENLDPNDITVTISDTKAPIIVLFGAKSSGKTMTLVRLTRYLQANHYQVIPDRVFRDGNDSNYNQMCDNFNKVIASDHAADSTNMIEFMLVKVIDPHNRTVCQILEAPGEHYFDESEPNKPFKPYIMNVCNNSNPKTWIFITEKDWRTNDVRRLYAQKIQNMQTHIRHRDKVIFMCHKADKHPHFIPKGIPNDKAFYRDINDQYPGIFNNYISNGIFGTKRNFRFVVFSAGSFSATNHYTQGQDFYPATLWNAIKKTLQGGWF